MDWCTLFPDRFGSYDLSAACAAHDEDFMCSAGFFSSNWRLYLRVKNLGLPVIAAIMLAGTSSPIGMVFYAKCFINRWMRLTINTGQRQNEKSS